MAKLNYDCDPYPAYNPDKPFVEPGTAMAIRHNLAHGYFQCFGRPAPSNPRILDSGCGTGQKTLWLSAYNEGATVHGCDASARSIDLAKQRVAAAKIEGVEFHTAEINKIPEELGKFDYINCDEVIYMQDDIELALRNLGKRLSKYGILRVNFHSFNQRRDYYRAQKLAADFGIFNLKDSGERVERFRELFDSLEPSTDILRRVWGRHKRWRQSSLLNNHLLEGDRGFSPNELRDTIRKAGLYVSSPVDPRGWNLLSHFKDLPEWIREKEEEMDWLEVMTICDIVHPKRRLIDFYLIADADSGSIPDWSKFDDDDALDACRFELSPVFQRKSIFEKVERAITGFSPIVLNEFWPVFDRRLRILDPLFCRLLVKMKNSSGIGFEALSEYHQSQVDLIPDEFLESKGNEAENRSKLKKTLGVLIADSVIFHYPN